MREIKYRMWNKKEKKMYEVGVLDFDDKKAYIKDYLNYTVSNYMFEDIELMQYTGLKDKNGKEIFEGDIILTQPLRTKPFSKNYKSKRLKGIVQYEIKSFRNFPNKMYTAGWDVEIIDKESFKKYRCWDWGLFLDCEVIRKHL